MAHFSEKAKALAIEYKVIEDLNYLPTLADGFSDVCIIRLPGVTSSYDLDRPLLDIESTIAEVGLRLGKGAVLAVIGEAIDLANVEAAIPPKLRYQHWVAVKRVKTLATDNRRLPNEHFGVLIHTQYEESLKHTKTRIKYTYCPACDRTTKDYGGKKHTYHADGTLISDVWRDIACDLNGDISPVVSRLSDLLGVEPYTRLMVLDCSNLALGRSVNSPNFFAEGEYRLRDEDTNRIIQGDCVAELRKLPPNSIDFVFADPPYNLRKKYLGYSDDLAIKRYFEWCDEWITEAARVLKPGRTLSILNIPLWAVRHLQFAESLLSFQNWIAWDALSFPVRLIMPAHYTILCLSKGESRALPGLTGHSGLTKPRTVTRTFDSLSPLADSHCLRADCVDKRLRTKMNDRSVLTDLWGDVHRVKHNSRRVDHPCQLPPQLMYRLISIFTKQTEVVLDCFNGAGTTTLSSHQLDRRYIGIESSEEYCAVTESRHQEIREGIDPFRKVDRELKTKNSPVARMPKQKYKVSKKVLQLDVRRIAQQLGHIPNREEVIELSKHPIDYFDNYFISWGEVTAAARTTGMTDRRKDEGSSEYDLTKPKQLRLLEKGKQGKRVKS